MESFEAFCPEGGELPIEAATLSVLLFGYSSLRIDHKDIFGSPQIEDKLPILAAEQRDAARLLKGIKKAILDVYFGDILLLS